MTNKDSEQKTKKTSVIYETDSDIDKVETEDKSDVKEIEIGSYKAHFDTAKKGLYEFRIWFDLTHALIAMASQNSYHRVDLRDKEFLTRISKDLELPIDYQRLQQEISLHNWLIQPNGMKVRPQVDKTKDESGKPLTKKALKTNVKRDKFQVKIDVLQKKYDAMKTHKGPRATKLKEKISELETKKDRA